MPADSIGPAAIRRVILEQAARAQVGHVGSALSVADIVATLYGGVLNLPAPDDPDRDRFILSNGHTSLALLAALHLSGRLAREDLDTYCGDGSRLGVHPQHCLPWIDFTTGSLGQGLPIATGAALGARLQRSPRRVVVVMSDAECNEGSVWEAAMFAAHHRLGNLVAIIDLNGQQALGHTRDVIDMSPMASRWRAFGWEAHDVDGHDARALRAAIGAFPGAAGPPRLIVAHTVFGRGVSFMESQVRWHYLPLTPDQLARALTEIEALESVALET